MQFSSKDNYTDLQHLMSGDLCSCSFILEKDTKTRRKVLQLVTEAPPPWPTSGSSGYQQVSDGNSPPRRSLVALHWFTGCDALLIPTSLEPEFKIYFFLCFIKSHLFPSLDMKACNILHYGRWAVGRATSHCTTSRCTSRDGSAGELAKAIHHQPLSSSCNTSVWLVLKYQHRS